MKLFTQMVNNDMPGKHITLHFAKEESKFPLDMFDGQEYPVWRIGKYEDDDISCDIVMVEVNDEDRFHQFGSITLLHITTYCRDGVSPRESGLRATANGYVKLDPIYMGMFKACFKEV